MTVSVEQDRLDDLVARVRGEVLTPADEGYDRARALWNAMIDKRPALIVRCAGVADVVNAVGFARTNGLPVSVRGGGHNAAGTALRDDALAIDLSPLKGIRVDAANRRARAEAGVLLGELDHETTALGLVTPLGIASTTGIAGLTLGGGVGYLMGKYGLACDNLVAADVVTAAGELLTASSQENVDLLWALRGGGGNFGVVTSFEYRLHPLEPITGGLVAHPGDAAREALHFYRNFTSSAPDSVVTFAGVGIGPPETPLEGEPMTFILACHCGPEADGARLLQPIKEFGDPVIDAIGPLPYTVMQRLFDAGYPPGKRSYWRSNFMNELADAAIDTVVERCAEGVPGDPGSAVFFEHMHGAVARVANTDTAFANRDAKYNLTVLPLWTDPRDDERITAWVRGFGDAMRPFSTGAGYVNYLAHDEGEQRVKATYGVNYERLAAIKKKYDPTNFFSGNQNIKPS